MASAKTREKYTSEFKFEAVRQVRLGQPISVGSKVLNIPKASLSNWGRKDGRGALSGAGDEPSVVVTPERMERDIAKKTAAYFAQDMLRRAPGFTERESNRASSAGLASCR